MNISDEKVFDQSISSINTHMKRKTHPIPITVSVQGVAMHLKLSINKIISPYFPKYKINKYELQ